MKRIRSLEVAVRKTRGRLSLVLLVASTPLCTPGAALHGPWGNTLRRGDERHDGEGGQISASLDGRDTRKGR